MINNKWSLPSAHFHFPFLSFPFHIPDSDSCGQPGSLSPGWVGVKEELDSYIYIYIPWLSSSSSNLQTYSLNKYNTTSTKVCAYTLHEDAYDIQLISKLKVVVRIRCRTIVVEFNLLNFWVWTSSGLWQKVGIG